MKVVSFYRFAPVDDPVAVQGRPQVQCEKKQLLGTILVAEDNIVNQELALEMLDQLGCEVVLATSGTEAVEAFEPGRFDLVLMDCQMPELDGYEATRRIRVLERKGHGQEKVPIVALTANAMEGDRERCIDAGMDDYLPKPFHFAALGAMLAKWQAAEASTTEP